MKTIQASDLKNMVNNPENTKVVRALFAAVAYCESVRAVVVPKQKEVLAFYRWPVSEQMQEKRNVGKDPVLDPKHSWTISDENFKIYDAEMQKFYKEAGFTNPPGCCPLLMAESTVRDVRRQVADFLEPYFGFGYDRLITGKLSDVADTYFDLLMTIFAPKVAELEKQEPFLKAA